MSIDIFIMFLPHDWSVTVSGEDFLSNIWSSILQLKENFTHHDQNRIREPKSITAAQYCCLPKRWDNWWEVLFCEASTAYLKLRKFTAEELELEGILMKLCQRNKGRWTTPEKGQALQWRMLYLV